MAAGDDLNDLSFAGMIAMWDPPRVGVAESMQLLQESGVSIKVITGDGRETAETIGEGVWLAQRCCSDRV